MLIDSHCHINLIVKKDFDVPLSEKEINDAIHVVNQAKEADVKKIINVGTNLIESKNCIELAKRFEGCFATVGIHPGDAKKTWKDELDKIKELTKEKEENKIVGIGECGLDTHYPDYNLQLQIDLFKAQIEMAAELNLPLIIHSRDASEELLKVLEEYKGQVKGVSHCFSQDLDFANQVIEWGFLIGIGGALTYPKNDYLRDVFVKVGLNKILLETDAPFLPPQEIRGQQNTPAQIANIAKYLGYLKKTSLEDVANQTTKNVEELFKI